MTAVDDPKHYEGGCACGALRYVSIAKAGEVGYCHCRICQRTTAAPALVFASFPVDAFSYVNGKPAIYASSAKGNREFCARCGTQTAYRKGDNPRHADVNVRSLDDPSRVNPDHHIWCSSRIAWFETRDNFPRFDQNRTGD